MTPAHLDDMRRRLPVDPRVWHAFKSYAAGFHDGWYGQFQATGLRAEYYDGFDEGTRERSERCLT